MYPRKYLFPGILVLVLMAVFVAPAAAQEIAIDSTTQFCFSSSDFLTQEQTQGVFITAVPKRSVAEVYYRDRLIRAGDALPAAALNELTLSPQCVTQQNTSVTYYPIGSGTVGSQQALKLSILPKKNDPPEAKDSQFETYKNIPNSGTLAVSDPEDHALTYEIVENPKRGSVELEVDGTFTYTPDHNKVGNDYFTFRVQDDAGQFSNEAKVTIRIKKPTDQEVYADMSGDPEAFEAMWLKDQEIFTGSTVGSNLCFSPNQMLTRGDFLVMVMKLVDAEASAAELSTGFADEAATPEWMQPYLVSALSNGMIRGSSTAEGVFFYPDEPMTKVEAAVMLQNILALPEDDVSPVFSQEETAIPTWALSSAGALQQAGIDLQILSEDDIMTRRDAARVLYAVSEQLDQEQKFFWVQ